MHNNELYLIDTLLLAAPCRFLREHDEVQRHSFEYINVNHVIFIVGDQKQNSLYAAMQGVIFQKEKIIISKRKIDVEDIFANQWMDGKFFLDVAYYP